MKMQLPEVAQKIVGQQLLAQELPHLLSELDKIAKKRTSAQLIHQTLTEPANPLKDFPNVFTGAKGHYLGRVRKLLLSQWTPCEKVEMMGQQKDIEKLLMLANGLASVNATRTDFEALLVSAIILKISIKKFCDCQ
jgi:hypothetical protein